MSCLRFAPHSSTSCLWIFSRGLLSAFSALSYHTTYTDPLPLSAQSPNLPAVLVGSHFLTFACNWYFYLLCLLSAFLSTFIHFIPTSPHWHWGLSLCKWDSERFLTIWGHTASVTRIQVSLRIWCALCSCGLGPPCYLIDML